MNLILVAPVLVVSAVLAWRGCMGARLVWTGTLLFLVYSYVLCCLEVHFNSPFLVYCAGLGFSFWAGMRRHDHSDPLDHQSKDPPLVVPT